MPVEDLGLKQCPCSIGSALLLCWTPTAGCKNIVLQDDLHWLDGERSDLPEQVYVDVFSASLHEFDGHFLIRLPK